MVIVLVSMNVLAWTAAPWLQDDPRRNRQQRTTIPQQDDDKNRPERGERRDNGNRTGQKRDSIVAQPIIDIEDEEIPDSLLHPRWQIQRTQPVTQEDLNRSATDLSMPANIEQKVEYNDTLGGYLIGSKMGGRYLGAPVLMTAEAFRETARNPSQLISSPNSAIAAVTTWPSDAAAFARRASASGSLPPVNST